jgi:hypothetical protein
MTRTRVGLLGVAAVLLGGLVVPSVLAQFPRGGQIPAPAPNPGMRPQMPDFPAGPQVERVWTCTGCGKEIGRGNFPPGTCPHCNAKIVNGIGNGDKPAQPDNGGVVPNPGGYGRQPGQVQPNPGLNPGGPPGGYGGMNQQQQPQPVPVTPVEPQGMIPPPRGVPGGDFHQPGWQPANTPQPTGNPIPSPTGQPTPLTTPTPTKPNLNWLTWAVFGVIGVAVVVIICAAIFWVFFLSNMLKSRTVRRAVAPRRKRRAARDYDDDDDDDDRPRRRR